MLPETIAAHSKTIDQSVEIITVYCSQILDRICGSAEQCPYILRVALRQLWQRVEERFCGSEHKVGLQRGGELSVAAHVVFAGLYGDP